MPEMFPVHQSGPVPRIGVLTATNRQQHRRIQRGEARCCRCGRNISTTDTPCFDDGKDAHLDCSKTRNFEIAKVGVSLIAQTAESQIRRDGIAVGFNRKGPARILAAPRS